MTPATLNLPLAGDFLLPPLGQHLAGQSGAFLPLRQLSRGRWLRLLERHGLRLLGLRHLLRQLRLARIELHQLADRQALARFPKQQLLVSARSRSPDGLLVQNARRRVIKKAEAVQNQN